LPELALRVDPTGMEKHELLGDRKTKARPARVLRLVETRKDVRQVLGSNASAAVRYRHLHLGGLSAALARDPHAASRERGLKRLGQMVGDALPDADRIDLEDGEVGGALDGPREARRLRLRAKGRDDVLEQRPEVDALAMERERAGLREGQRAEIL